jgi:hypothetical protein
MIVMNCWGTGVNSTPSALVSGKTSKAFSALNLNLMIVGNCFEERVKVTDGLASLSSGDHVFKLSFIILFNFFG